MRGANRLAVWRTRRTGAAAARAVAGGSVVCAAAALAACAVGPGDVRDDVPVNVEENEGYAWYVTGDPGDVSPATRGLLVLQGGGDDVDANYERMGEFAGGGDFVVLRASGADEYNEYIYALCGCDSVETLVFASREAAYDSFVLERLRRAEAVFIAGGDQSNYVRFWKGTPVADAIEAVAAKPAPVGGTSAGMAIMGEFAYSAMTPESLTSAVALADPFAADLTLERDFLHFAGLEGILTDQHLIERDRIGRTVAMLARLAADGWARDGRAIAADRETAVHLDPATGLATVYATAEHETPYAYFLRTGEAPSVCAPGVPLSIAAVHVYRVEPGGRFDTRAWTGTGGTAYEFAVEAGQLGSSRGSIY